MSRVKSCSDGVEAQLVQPVQEPVGMVESSEEWGVAGVLIAGLPIGTKLYAAPVEREWVDLTDDEIGDAWEQCGGTLRVFWDIASFAFKEKNK